MLVLPTRYLLTNCKLFDNHCISLTLCCLVFVFYKSPSCASLPPSVCLSVCLPSLLLSFQSGFSLLDHRPSWTSLSLQTVGASFTHRSGSHYRACLCVMSSFQVSVTFLVGDIWSCSMSSGIHPQWFTIYIFIIVYTVIFCCWFILYTQHLLHVCPSWERDPSRPRV